MFTKGQLIFAIIFIILFSLIIGYSYIKDSRLHNVYYKNSYVILIVFIVLTSIISAYTNLFS